MSEAQQITFGDFLEGLRRQIMAPDERGTPFEIAKVEAFIAYHEANPQVFELLKKRALELRGKGRKRYGINGLCEVVRWHLTLHTTGDEFKLNNNHRPFYARMLMALAPELKGFFATRGAVADKMEVQQ